jgi:hypothetical protein
MTIARKDASKVEPLSIANADLLRQFPEYGMLREQIRHSDQDWRPTFAQGTCGLTVDV